MKLVDTMIRKKINIMCPKELNGLWVGEKSRVIEHTRYKSKSKNIEKDKR